MFLMTVLDWPFVFLIYPKVLELNSKKADVHFNYVNVNLFLFNFRLEKDQTVFLYKQIGFLDFFMKFREKYFIFF